ncbi:MAG: hypothetical protein O3A51_03235 [Verrucomicrobia bacterium]|nr:hypothetical protein [Verrucomicrobiota bacterium]
MLPLTEGAASRRPGTKFHYDLPGDAFLIDFLFNDSQLYLLAFGNARMDAFNGGTGALLSSLTSQPWTLAQAQNIGWAQSGDTLILCHEDVAPQLMLRVNATTFSNAAFTFEDDGTTSPKIYEPFYRFGDTVDTTLTPSATTGSVTVTASAALFSSDWVGHCIQMDNFKYLHVTAYIDTTNVTCLVKDTLSGTGAFDDWLEPAFSVDRGYPRTAIFHQGRLWFFGSKSVPDGFWSSGSNAFFNFDIGTGLADESIQGVLGEAQINEIRTVIAVKELQVFTDQAELYITGSPVITPANVSVKPQTRFGSKKIRPLNIDGATLFVQNTGSTIREFEFSSLTEIFTAEAVSLIASPLINSPVDMTGTEGFNDGSEKLAFVCNGDGTLAVFHSVRSENIAAWVPWTTDGLFKSVRSVSNRVFVVVEREINSVTKFYLESFDTGFSVDCGIDVTGPGTSWAGMSHLEAEVVDVVAGLFYLGTKTVASAAFTTDESHAAIQAGMPFTAEIKPNPAEPAATVHGRLTGHPKRISRVLVQTHETITFSVNGREILSRLVDDDFSVVPTKESTIRDIRLLGYSREPSVTLSFPRPLPATIVGLTMEVVFE